jgi:hypothetical protein
MIIANEFAVVDVALDTQGKGPRLRVEDKSTGQHIFLDPLELQALAWASHKDLAVFARPFFKERAAERLMGRVASDAALLEAESILRQFDEER